MFEKHAYKKRQRILLALLFASRVARSAVGVRSCVADYVTTIDRTVRLLFAVLLVNLTSWRCQRPARVQRSHWKLLFVGRFQYLKRNRVMNITSS